MAWQFNNKEAVFLQIADRIRNDILRGIYRPGDQLPPVRQLAMDATVNPNTMQKALTHLESEGLLYARGTVGRFVTSDTAIIEKAREKKRREAMHRILEEAELLGITADDLIAFITEEQSRRP